MSQTRSSRGGAVGGHARAPVDGGRLATGGCAVECRGGGGGLNLQVELLEEKLIADVVEGGEWHGPLDEILQVVVAGAKTTQKVQHEGAVGDEHPNREESIMPFI